MFELERITISCLFVGALSKREYLIIVSFVGHNDSFKHFMFLQLALSAPNTSRCIDEFS